MLSCGQICQVAKPVFLIIPRFLVTIISIWHFVLGVVPVASVTAFCIAKRSQTFTIFLPSYLIGYSMMLSHFYPEMLQFRRQIKNMQSDFNKVFLSTSWRFQQNLVTQAEIYKTQRGEQFQIEIWPRSIWPLIMPQLDLCSADYEVFSVVEAHQSPLRQALPLRKRFKPSI